MAAATPTPAPLPVADLQTGREVLRELAKDRSLLTALTIMYRRVGPAFQITMPRFRPAVVVGADTNRQVLVTDRDKFSWRSETDPVTRLLRQGVLVVDGDLHDRLRAVMDPPLHRKNVIPHVADFWRTTDDVVNRWRDGETRDMLVEMRRAALLILMGTTFRVDFAPDIDHLWQSILRLLAYISPGLWIMWADMPRPGYRRAIQQMDDYLYTIIRRRRAELAPPDARVEHGDLLGALIRADMSDDLIRDQLLTMLIAGHDTSTALLVWTLYLLGRHSAALARVQAEVDATLGDADAPPTFEQVEALTYLDLVIKEALRLYPPIHVGNRVAREDLVLQGYTVPARTRVMYSIYLSHRDLRYWSDPERFDPERFDKALHPAPPAFAYVPFGGGPRNCIGAAFAQVEAKVALARILQRFDLTLLNGDEIRPSMGATLEPQPGVRMRVRRRRPA